MKLEYLQMMISATKQLGHELPETPKNNNIPTLYGICLPCNQPKMMSYRETIEPTIEEPTYMIILKRDRLRLILDIVDKFDWVRCRPEEAQRHHTTHQGNAFRNFSSTTIPQRMEYVYTTIADTSRIVWHGKCKQCDKKYWMGRDDWCYPEINTRYMPERSNNNVRSGT
jgi:hypothetical protein